MRKTFTTFFFLIVFSSLTFGWGKTGHNIIVEIAKKTVSKSIQDSVEKYLGSMSWELASTWMDEIRKDPQYDYMKTWHYVNIEQGKKYDSTIADGKNVVQQLIIAIRKLNNKAQLTNDQKFLEIKILFHLIGDLHQPLHVGYATDKGGTLSKVIFDGKSTNLHYIWDSDIISYKEISTEAVYKEYQSLTQDSINKTENFNVSDWLDQTRKTLDKVYGYKSSTIDDDYINTSSEIIKDQLLIAGLRLGKVLTVIFSDY